MKKKKFIDLDEMKLNFQSFDDCQNSWEDQLSDLKKNQLFSKSYPPFDLVKKILNLLIHYDYDEIHYEFTKKMIQEKKVLERFEEYIDELKKYYLKCKHTKYLENIDEKKYITILRQILKPYQYTIKSYEKYNCGKKFLLYVISKNKENNLMKKINSTVSFD